MTAGSDPLTLACVTTAFQPVSLSAIALEAPAESDEPVVRWLHLASSGTRRGHPQGAFTLDEAVFASFVANLHAHPQFRRGADGRGCAPVVPFDYEHASAMPPTSGSIPATGAPAPAWLLDLEVRKGEDGRPELWGLTQLGTRVASQIRSKEYRWVSIYFDLQGADPVSAKPTGPVLRSVAFTNQPFLQDLKPLAASTRAAALLAATQVRAVGLATTDGGTPPESSMDPETPTPTSNDLSSLLAALGVSDPTAALAAIPELMAAKQKLADAMAQIDALTTAQAKVEEQMAEAEVSAALSMHFPDPKLAARVRPALVALRAKGREAFAQHYPLPQSAQAGILLSTLVAGRNGTQIEPPKQVPVGETRADTDKRVIDLRSLPGRNVTERLLTHLRQSDPNLVNATLDALMGRAHALRHDAGVELLT